MIFRTLFKREMQALFLSPVAYIFAMVMLFGLGMTFLFTLGGLATAVSPDFSLQELLDRFMGGNVLFWFVVIPIVTAITMRLFAEEKRSGTIETLLTAPVTDWQVVMSKYLGALVFYMLLWVPTLFFFSCLGAKGLDFGLLAGSYLGVLLVGALFISVGCLISSLCTSQVTAAILCAGALTAATLAPYLCLNARIDSDLFKEVCAYFNLLPAGPHSLMGDLNRGLITVTHLAYPVTATACCLFLTCKAVESRSWK